MKYLRLAGKAMAVVLLFFFSLSYFKMRDEESLQKGARWVDPEVFPFKETEEMGCEVIPVNGMHEVRRRLDLKWLGFVRQLDESSLRKTA